jgi:hypothetical protein
MRLKSLLSIFLILLMAVSAMAQQSAPVQGSATGSRGGRGGGRGAQAPPVVSPEVSADGKITFRLFAPRLFR